MTKHEPLNRMRASLTSLVTMKYEYKHNKKKKHTTVESLVVNTYFNDDLVGLFEHHP